MTPLQLQLERAKGADREAISGAVRKLKKIDAYMAAGVGEQKEMEEACKAEVIQIDWPRSGPVQTVAFFGDRLKRLDRTVQHLRTAVRFQKYWTRPFSPVFLSLENGDR